jgi:hypothetical protein
MKKLYATIGAVGILLAPNLYASIDGTAILNWNPEYPNNGGPFEVVSSANGSFSTFCVSIVTTFSPGSSYYYEISPNIVADIPPTVPTYIPFGSAYLYSQVLNGNTFNGVADGGVQATIWYLQGLLNGMVDPENGADLSSIINPVLAQLESDTGLGLAQLTANGNGAYGVEAMNLYTGDDNGVGTGVSQPQLYQTPEPTTIIAGALMLLPFGASTLRILRKTPAA